MAEHLSYWHDFNAEDRKTYPEMNTFDIILNNKLKASIVAWRYIKSALP
jgi:hypothetical protein